MLDQFWSHLGPCRPSWAYLGTLLDQFGAILGYLRPSWPKRGSFTNGVKALQNFKRSLSVSERGDCCIGGHLLPCWGIFPGELFLGPFLVQFLDGFWARFGGQKWLQNWSKIGSKIDQTLSHFLYSCFCNFGFVLEPKSSQKGDKSGSGRWPRGGLGGSRHVFAHMHLDSIFTVFLEHQAS